MRKPPIRNLSGRIQVRLLVSLVMVLALTLLAGCGYSGDSAPAVAEETPAPSLSADQVRLNQESFDIVWETIRDKHWDPDLGGLDWPAVKAELQPGMDEARTMSEARQVMQEMIGRLDQSHFGIFPANVYEDAAAEGEAGGGEGVTGLDVRVRENRVLVVGVQPASPAAKAGIKPGWVVLAVGEMELADRVKRLQEALPDNSSKRLVMSRGLGARLQGKPGDTLALTLLDGEGAEVSLDLDLEPESGVKTDLGNLPAVWVRHQTRILPGNVGYFGFNYFLGIMEVMPAFNKAMADFKDCSGVIIDLRGNPGGLGAMAMGMSGWFLSEKGQQLGVMTMRTGSINFAVNPRANSYQGPLALLVDEVTASTAEIMAGGLQDLDRAKLFGISSAGAALPSVIEKLPNGDGFQYAIANYESQGGMQLEGQGVHPDFEIPGTREALLANEDPVLDAALKWIAKQ